MQLSNLSVYTTVRRKKISLLRTQAETVMMISGHLRSRAFNILTESWLRVVLLMCS